MKKRYLLLISLFLVPLNIRAEEHSSGLFGRSREIYKWFQTHIKKVPLTSTAVFMDNCSEITLPHGSSEAQSIFSFGFGGCVGIATYYRFKNGDQKAVLAHYSPLRLLTKLRSYNNRHQRLTDDNTIIDQTETIMLVPGDYVLDKNTQKWNLTVAEGYNNYVENMQQLATDKLSLEFYDVCISLGEHDNAPHGKFNEHLVPKELEVVLMPNPKESFWQSKASYYTEHLFDDNKN